MSNEKEKPSPLSSFLPLVLLGASAFFLIQYLGPEKKKNNSQQNVNEVETQSDLNDFVFSSGPGNSSKIQTNNFIAVFSARGGRIEKLYLTSNDQLTIPDSVTKEKKDGLASEYKALEVSRQNGLDFQPHLYFKNSDSQNVIQVGNPPLNQGAFKQSGPFRDEKTGIQEIQFKLPLTLKGQNLELHKIYRFLPDEYYFHQITLIQNKDKKPFDWGGDLFYKYMGDMGPSPQKDDTYSFTKFTRFYYYADSMSTVPAIKGEGGGMSCGLSFCGSDNGNEHFHALLNSPNSLQLAGSTSKYFFTYNKFLGSTANPLSQPDGIIVVNEADPSGNKSQTVFFSNFKLDSADSAPVSLASNGSSYAKQIRELQKRKDILLIDNMVYVGVRRDESHIFKDLSLIKSEFGVEEPDSHAREIIYSNSFFTMFSWLTDSVVWIMRNLYNLIGNYGWVIIIMATALKLVTWPLNQMQAKSMKRMSALKPEIESINDKFKDNPTEKQKQIMLLYKKHNVNPAKGCFPILIQLPVFIALYSAFSDSIELWRSPFILWMHDLSLPDTIFVVKDFLILHDFHLNVLPLIMVVSQILQQMFTTVVTDPQQKTIMYFMPVIMIFFFWNMPSGVTLYWTVQNILSILWQFASDKLSDDVKEKPAT